MTDIVERLRVQRTKSVLCAKAADEIERLRELAEALYEETKRCGSKHDVKATNDWEEYDEAVRGG